MRVAQRSAMEHAHGEAAARGRGRARAGIRHRHEPGGHRTAFHHEAPVAVYDAAQREHVREGRAVEPVCLQLERPHHVRPDFGLAQAAQGLVV